MCTKSWKGHNTAAKTVTNDCILRLHLKNWKCGKNAVITATGQHFEMCVKKFCCMNLCMSQTLGNVQPISILIRQHSRHTICNKGLMKEEYGWLPASFSALQSAHVIGGRVGSTAAYSSPLLTHWMTNPRKHCILHCSSATNHQSPSSTFQWHCYNVNPRIWSKIRGIWHKAPLW